MVGFVNAQTLSETTAGTIKNSKPMESRSQMINYNICFVKRENYILMLNRNFKPWMGCWNGVGGKIEVNETAKESVVREIYEETGITEYELQFKGLITWSIDGNQYGGMFLYIANVANEFTYETPIRTNEGILDWKPIEWIKDPYNMGVAANVPISIEMIVNDYDCYEHHCTYVDGKLVGHESIKINSKLETDNNLRDEYLSKYLGEGSGIR